MSRAVHFVPISGGKDSLATALVAKERGIEVRYCSSDTGNEDSGWLDYLNYLENMLGQPIEILQADFTERMAERRRTLPDDWGKEKRRTSHKNGCNRQKGCGCPVVVSPPMPPELIAKAIALMHPTGNTYLDLCMLKGRFPSRRAQFCTEELKVTPFDEHIAPLLISGRSVVTWLGERAQESMVRAARPSIQRIRWSPGNLACKVLYRPIQQWRAEECFAIAKRHGIKPNPLYLLGFKRVGCRLCINMGKDDVQQVAKWKPDWIDIVREWEAIVAEVSRRRAATFFSATTVPGTHPQRASIDNVTAWASTSHGGLQFDAFRFADIGRAHEEGHMCESAYGLCE